LPESPNASEKYTSPVALNASPIPKISHGSRSWRTTAARMRHETAPLMMTASYSQS